MGCDIHVVLEKKFGNKWVGLKEVSAVHHIKEQEGVSPSEWKQEYIWTRARSRNYYLFAKLAGVRGEGPDPKGLPDDASELSRALYSEDDSDLHSHSYCSLREYLEALVETSFDAPKMLLGDKHPAVTHPMMFWFGEYEPEEDEEYRVVFCFDN